VYDFRRLKCSSPKPPHETAWDHYKNNEFSHEAFGVRYYAQVLEKRQVKCLIKPSL
jgi:hypothetical protein